MAFLCNSTVIDDAVAVALPVERQTSDQEVAGSTFTAGATTLGKLFTPLCLCHQAV